MLIYQRCQVYTTSLQPSLLRRDRLHLDALCLIIFFLVVLIDLVEPCVCCNCIILLFCLVFLLLLFLCYQRISAVLVGHQRVALMTNEPPTSDGSMSVISHVQPNTYKPHLARTLIYYLCEEHEIKTVKICSLKLSCLGSFTHLTFHQITVHYRFL